MLLQKKGLIAKRGVPCRATPTMRPSMTRLRMVMALSETGMEDAPKNWFAIGALAGLDSVDLGHELDCPKAIAVWGRYEEV